MENIKKLVEKENIEFVRGSITDLDLLRRSFKDIDYVSHQLYRQLYKVSLIALMGSGSLGLRFMGMTHYFGRMRLRVWCEGSGRLDVKMDGVIVAHDKVSGDGHEDLRGFMDGGTVVLM
jgi:hypothetical protein